MDIGSSAIPYGAVPARIKDRVEILRFHIRQPHGMSDDLYGLVFEDGAGLFRSGVFSLQSSGSIAQRNFRLLGHGPPVMPLAMCRGTARIRMFGMTGRLNLVRSGVCG